MATEQDVWDAILSDDDLLAQIVINYPIKKDQVERLYLRARGDISLVRLAAERAAKGHPRPEDLIEWWMAQHDWDGVESYPPTPPKRN